jgi:hypothetical protein
LTRDVSDHFEIGLIGFFLELSATSFDEAGAGFLWVTLESAAMTAPDEAGIVMPPI